MVKALVLRTNGTCEEMDLKGYEAYQKVVGGNFEMVPITKGYVDPNQKTTTTKKKRLTCYANEEGLMLQLPTNPWGGFLQVLGAYISHGFLIVGDVIVMGTNKDGDDGNVDPYIVSLAKEFIECEDEDEFYVNLETLNTPIKKKKKSEEVVVITKKKRQASSDVASKKAKNV